jgi:hypothetical protein
MSYAMAVLLLLTASAQAPSADAIALQISSQDPRTIAWGAYNAAAYRHRDAIPRLQQLLESPPAMDEAEARAFIDVVMDALIQLDARVPARLLVPYHGTRPAPSFVLLSRGSGREGLLLEMLPRLSGVRWFAAANMMLEDRSYGLVEHLVRNVKLRLTVHVADNENVGFGTGGGLSVGIACGIGQDPPDYPPHAEYRLHFGAQPGAVVLATGPQPIYYTRVVTTDFQYGVSETDMGGPSDEQRVDYLRAMSADPIENPFRAHTETTVTWSTADALTQRVQELRSDIERRFRSLIYRAQQFSSVPRSAVVIPPIELRIVDQRTIKAVPLPNIAR